MPEWVIEKLAVHHGREDFDCGKPSLSEWLKRYAGQNETRDVSRTFVAVRPGNPRVLGYYCLSSYQIQFNDVPPGRAKKLPRAQPVPAVLIGRLAVHTEAQGQGLGAILLLDAFARTLRTAEQIGTHAIVVDAIDEQAHGFYLKYGFEELLDDRLHLFITLKVVRQLGLSGPVE